MIKTHYERFVERIDPHRARAKQCADVLANESTPIEKNGVHTTLGQLPGIWLHMIMQQKGQVTDGKRRACLYAPNKYYSPQKMSDAVDAFLWETCSRIFDGSANPDGTWSISNTMYKNKDLFMFMHTIVDMAGSPDAAGSGAQALVEVCMQGVSHERSGQRVYEVTPGLADKLKHTELRGLTSEDLRVPFNSIYITVPKETGFAVYNDSDEQWHDLEGVYILEDKFSLMEPAPPHKVEMNDRMELSVNDGIALKDRQQLRSLSIMFCGGPGKDDAGKPIKGDDALFFFRLYLPDGRFIDDCVADTNKRNKRYDKHSLIDHMGEKWVEIFRWCLNVLMYATCCDPDEELLDKDSKKLWERMQAAPEGSKTRANLKKKLDTLKGGNKRTVLGRNIVIDRSKPEYDSGTGTGRKIQIRTRVAGHWRRVRYGKNWASRRMTFVEPFWRGPELGEESAKRHVLK